MITFKDVSYKINNKTILNKISFNIKDGEVVLISGNSGSGKSTILNLIALNIHPTQGNIYYDSQNINDFNENETAKYKLNELIIIYQEDDLFNQLTVNDNLLLYYEQKDINNILKKTKLYHLKDKLVGNLSGGERQRISIINGLLSKCNTILCDEITSALDEENAKQIIDFIMRYSKNKTLIFISHTPDLYLKYVDHIIYVENQKITEDIINDKSVKYRKRENQQKSKASFFFKFGLKKFSIKQLILFILAFVCTFIFLNYNKIFEQIAINSYQKYYNYNVFFVENGTLDIDNTIIFQDYQEVLSSSEVFLNGDKYNQIVLLPFINDDKEEFVITSSLLDGYGIEKLNEIRVENSYFKINSKNFKIITQNEMFSTPCIYYNYKYISSYLSSYTSDKTIYVSNTIPIDDRLTTNPLYEENNDNKPYLDSMAMKDYLTYKMVFTSIEMIINYYFIMCFAYAFISSLLLQISSILKDIKIIAIFRSRGVKTITLLLTYSIPLIIYSLILSGLIMIALYVFKLAYSYLIASIASNLIVLMAIIIAFMYIKHRPIHENLKEEEIC